MNETTTSTTITHFTKKKEEEEEEKKSLNELATDRKYQPRSQAAKVFTKTGAERSAEPKKKTKKKVMGTQEEEK